MKVIEEYLKGDLGKPELAGWKEIRESYLTRAIELVKGDYQSPSYLTSLESLAGRREGKIIGNINDYTRDQHDLSLSYEKKFVKEYLPRVSILPLEAYVTSSGMAALATVVMMLHREHGVEHAILVGKHSYFQNLELLSQSFAKVIVFDENDKSEWQKLILKHNPLAVFVDTLCNETELTVPPVIEISKYMESGYLVVDNTMLATGFPWKRLLKEKSRKLTVIGWESLNKYYQFGLDRTTGGVVWGSSIKSSVALSCARRHSGTILPDINAAMLPSPSLKVMKKYLERIDENKKLMTDLLDGRGVCANTTYSFGGAQVIIKFPKKLNYVQIQRLIRKIISRAAKEKVQLVAGTSFGMPNTRIYLTARHTGFAQMFLRLSVGTEEKETIEKLGRIIASSL